MLSAEQREYALLRRERAMEIIEYLGAGGDHASPRASRLLRFVADLDEILASDSLNWN